MVFVLFGPPNSFRNSASGPTGAKTFPAHDCLCEEPSCATSVRNGTLFYDSLEQKSDESKHHSDSLVSDKQSVHHTPRRSCCCETAATHWRMRACRDIRDSRRNDVSPSFAFDAICKPQLTVKPEFTVQRTITGWVS